jgi:hypothetical protein
MHISLIKVSEEFNNVNGRHLWLGCDVVVNEGENAMEAFKNAMQLVLEANTLASETESLPVIQVNRQKSEMDVVILKKYNQALADNDEVTLKQIRDNYYVES